MQFRKWSWFSYLPPCLVEVKCWPGCSFSMPSPWELRTDKHMIMVMAARISTARTTQHSRQAQTALFDPRVLIWLISMKVCYWDIHMLMAPVAMCPAAGPWFPHFCQCACVHMDTHTHFGSPHDLWRPNPTQPWQALLPSTHTHRSYQNPLVAAFSRGSTGLPGHSHWSLTNTQGLCPVTDTSTNCLAAVALAQNGQPLFQEQSRMCSVISRQNRLWGFVTGHSQTKEPITCFNPLSSILLCSLLCKPPNLSFPPLLLPPWTLQAKSNPSPKCSSLIFHNFFHAPQQ